MSQSLSSFAKHNFSQELETEKALLLTTKGDKSAFQRPKGVFVVILRVVIGLWKWFQIFLLGNWLFRECRKPISLLKLIVCLKDAFTSDTSSFEMRSTWKTSLTAVRESFAALRSFQNSNDSEIQLSSNKNLGEFLSLQMMWPMLILFAAKRVVVCASLCNQHRNLEVVARVIAARRWIGKVAAQTRRWRKTNIQRDKKKQKKQTRRKQCQRHNRHRVEFSH